ncbi:DNA-binding protein SMUBP-2-like isoform X2 [Brevipalpus obovatus]
MILNRDLSCYKDLSTSVCGVVTKISREDISILVHEGHDLDISPELTYMLQKEPDGVSYGRLKRTLQALTYPSEPDSRRNLDKIFFGEIPVPPEVPSGDLEFFNNNLDNSQKNAVKFALAQEKVALIFGPPGTGKTTTVIEILHQLKRQNKRVLVTTPSNIALDNMMERLHRDGFRDMVRLGHPARTDPNLISYTLESILKRLFGPGSSHRHKKKKFVEPPLDRKVREKKLLELTSRRQIIEARLDEINPMIMAESQRAPINYENIPKSLPYRRQFGTDCLQAMSVFNSHSFVFSTLVSASREGPLGYLVDGAKKHFDVLIIDESSQALEIACWVALPLAEKVILVGDPKQLPPTVLSRSQGARALEVTLMERCILARDGRFDHSWCMLVNQYRMHQDIMEWPSKTFYQGKLKADPSVAMARLDSNLMDWPTLMLVDTINAEMFDSHPDDDLSCSNESEAKIVAQYVRFLTQYGVKEKSIGVITPYKLQVKLIRNMLEEFKDVTIKTVDGFQGREKDAIILSLVRSNENGDIGFLNDMKRINVAITRAKKHLVVICDSRTISKHSTLNTFVEYLYEKASMNRCKVIGAKAFREKLEEMQPMDEDILAKVFENLKI